MKRMTLAALLAATMLAGCGGSSAAPTYHRSYTAYAPHCFLFRQRHLVILHRTYTLKFYTSAAFHHYLATHPGIQYRPVSCYGYRGYAYTYTRYGRGTTGGHHVIRVVKSLYQRYKAHRASRHH